MYAAARVEKERYHLMARPPKQGLDYFPLDTELDTKFKLIEAEFGLTGFAIVVKLLQMIYGGFGYYGEWTTEVALLFSQNCGGGKVVSEIVRAAVKRGIFDKGMYEKYSILTSKGIQERYFTAVNRRTQTNIRKEYLLVQFAQNSENVCNNSVNVDNNSVNVCRNAQIKEKKKKIYYGAKSAEKDIYDYSDLEQLMRESRSKEGN